MTIKAVHTIVKGRVQGVWFRAHTQSEARRLGLSGTVRNLADGTVEIVAEGEARAVEELERWVWTGSPHSEVSEVAVTERSPSGTFSSFETRY